MAERGKRIPVEKAEKDRENAPKLEVRGISYSIDHKLIIEGLNLQVKKGSFVGIVGPNGCGKSTLLKNIYKVYSPDSGVAFLDGKTLWEMPDRERAHNMSVMQQENHVEFDMTVFDMVMLGRFAYQRMFHTDKAEDRKIVMEYIREVGLEGYENRYFLSLSGGEKQRTLLARALAQKAPLIILDEPTNHLDIGYQYQIMNILKRQKLTVLSCIHDLNIAAAYCDEIVLIRKGHVFGVGRPEEMLTDENIYRLFGIHARIIPNDSTGKLHIIFLPELQKD